MSNNSYTQRDAAANDSDKTIVFNSRGVLAFVFVTLVTTADVGNRQLELQITDAADNVIYACPAGAVQAASLTRRYLFIPEAAREAAFVATSITVPLPAITIPKGGKLRVLDTAVISAAADDMTVVYEFDPEG